MDERCRKSWEEWKCFQSMLPDLMRDENLRGRWVVFYSGKIQSVWPNQDLAYTALEKLWSKLDKYSGAIAPQVAEPEPVYLRYS